MPGVSFRSWSSAGVRWFSALALLAAPAGPAFAAPSTISVRNYGAYPDWSPYKGTVIEKAITFGQNNHFADNSYFGSWGFTAYDQSRKLTRKQWRAKPYLQDQGSTFH